MLVVADLALLRLMKMDPKRCGRSLVSPQPLQGRPKLADDIRRSEAVFAGV